MLRVTKEAIESALTAQGIPTESCELRDIPGEVNALVTVLPKHFNDALEAADAIESSLASQFRTPTLLVIRKAAAAQSKPTPSGSVDITHQRVDELLNLIAARNRVSEVQPSLSYVRDAAGNLALATAQRNHIILGRRGVGKSTLLMEAKKRLDAAHAVTVWVNYATYRQQTPNHVLALTLREVLNAIILRMEREKVQTRLLASGASALETVEMCLAQPEIADHEINHLTPSIQSFVKQSLNAMDLDLFLFIDDFYLIPRDLQPKILDSLHGCIRDCRAWLKIATIKNLSRWFINTPPTGLQTGHDADLIDLDVSLQEPAHVSEYLQQIFSAYCAHAGITRIADIFYTTSMDRLVLASGGVPRDFLVLASQSIREARKRPKGKVVGVQDVNLAAGGAADAKLAELEEDVAANQGASARTLEARRIVRDFCLEEQKYTFFRIDFRHKESNPHEYQLIGELLDLRMIHLIHDSLSDAHEAGRKYEVYLLDLSLFSGTRLKQKIWVIDLEKKALIMKLTTTKQEPLRARDSKGMVAMLRRGPEFSLDLLAAAAAHP